MSDSDASDTAATERESHLVGCSVRGPSHEEEDTPCQDAWAGTQLSDSRFAFAVADGLGSASHSHRGSEIASETAVEYLEEVLTSGNFDGETLRDAIKMAFKSARSALQDEADRQGVSIRDLNTTLLVAAGGPSGVAAAAVGDGGVIRVYRDEFYLFVPRENSEYANRTTPVQSDHWEESYRFEYSENVDGVAAFSDGLENIAWDGKEEPQAALFKQFFNFVWHTTDEERINEELTGFLNHERYRSISGDDKTIAIATLDVDYENREPLTDTEESEPIDRSQDTSTTADSSTAVTDPTPESSNAGSRTDEESKEKSPDHLESESSTNKQEAKPTKIGDGTQADEQEIQVVKADGTTVQLKECVGLDQTGVVCTTHDDRYPAVKIFERKNRGKPQRQKVAAMAENPVKTRQGSRERNTVLQWPAAVLTDYSEGTFLGCAYTDPTPTSGQTIAEFAYSGGSDETFGSRVGTFIKSFRTTYAGPSTNRYETAVDLAATVNALHQQDVAMCDFDPHNIIITDSELHFAMCDRYAVDSESHYYSPTRVEERYIPQKEIGESIKENQYTDRFGLAVHLYRLLLKGKHPFGNPGHGGENEGALSPEQLKPHITKDSSEVTAGALKGVKEAERYAELPRMIRYHFEQCFIEGFDAPAERPSARQWVEILTEERG
jgi:hypothetical protein